MKLFFISVGVACLLICLSVIGCIVSGASWFADRTVAVAKQQFDPQELLRKYELFKDEAAQLDAKVADIKIKEHQIKDMKGLPMDRTNREQMMIWQQELGGIKYSYNSLAADYNAQMVKFNYRFCNVGTLPEGATTPLPREYKPYMEE